MAEEALTDADLAAIEQRCAQATPGPWLAWLETRHGTGGGSFIQLNHDPDLDDEMYVRRFVGIEEVPHLDAQLEADLDFMAEARQDVPRLLAEVRRLRARLAEER